MASLGDAIDAQLANLLQPTHDGDSAHAHARIHTAFGDSPDVVRRPVSSNHGVAMTVYYIDGLVSPQLVDTAVVGPLSMDRTGRAIDGVVQVGEVKRSSRWQTILHHLTMGYAAVFTANDVEVLLCDTSKLPQRSVGRAETEATIVGPQEAFTEPLGTQMGQLRRTLPDQALRFSPVAIGTQRCAIAYLTNVANPQFVEMMRERLSRIEAVGILNATMVGSLIRDHPRSIFPTVRYTEHVSFVKWQLLQGRVAVLTDGDPFAIIAPATFRDFYSTPMDYSSGWYDASFVRIVRVVGFVISVLLPSLYIVFSSVDQQLVPYQLLLIVMGSHTGLPFSPFVEAVIMIFMIEVIREAALRMPKPLAGALGTMGAIVVGTAIVKSGLVSNQVIVIITVTALSLFSVPAYEMVGAVRLFDIALIIAGAVFGLFGVVATGFTVSALLLSMSSFGVPYLAPIVPPHWDNWRDTWVRLPYGQIEARPTALRPLNLNWLHLAGSGVRRPGRRPNR